MITLKDIAARCGVSVPTVSLVLNDRPGARIAAETRKRVLEAAKSMGYAGSRNRPEWEVGAPVLLYVFQKGGREHLGTSFFAAVLRGLRTHADVAVIEVEFDPSDPIRSYRRILAFRASGYVTHCGSFLEAMKSHGDARPVFMLQGEGRPFGPPVKDIHYIVDDLTVGRTAAECLRRRGCTRVAVVFPRSRGRCRRERFDGFEGSFSEQGGTLTAFDLTDISCSAVEEYTRSLGPEYDGFYFFSDAMAIAGMRGLMSRGVRIPGDAMVIGTDNLHWGRFTVPSLTTMDLHEEVFADRILGDFTSFRNSGRVESVTVRVPVELVERESTTIPRPA